MIETYGYVRCSGLGQMDGEGPDRQQSTIISFASGHEYSIVQWYIESHTGTDLEGRPEFSAMRSAMVSNGVHCVIVEKLDRLARSVLIQETIIADFKENGIQLLSATPGEEDLCGDDPTRILIRQILGAFFQYERAMIVGKLKSARDRIKGNGRRPGQKNYSPDPVLNCRVEGRRPFGQDKDRPEEHKVLAQMIALRKMGNNPEQIAKFLNAQGTPTRYGKSWLSQGVSRILARNKPESVAA